MNLINVEDLMSCEDVLCIVYRNMSMVCCFTRYFVMIWSLILRDGYDSRPVYLGQVAIDKEVYKKSIDLVYSKGLR